MDTECATDGSLQLDPSTRLSGAHSHLSLFPLAAPTMPACALFVIDIQVALARTAATEIPHAERIRDRATQILDKARSANDASEGGKAIAVVVVQHEESAESGDLQRGTAAWELVCPPRVDEQLVSKTVGGCPCCTG